MKAANRVLLSGILCALASVQVHAAQADASPFAKDEWMVAATFCPAGCSAYTQRFLTGLQGKLVRLDAAHFEAPFVDACEGSIRYALNHTSAQAVVAEVNRGVPPRHKKLTPKALGLSVDQPVTAAAVFCQAAAAETGYQRILAIEPARVLILFEEQSIIELR